MQNFKKLINVIQDLSLAKTMDEITAIVRVAARELTGADGATFVLRDKDHCYYADEDAISPLWKGKRFPMSLCISGWVMIHGEAVTIPDIYLDSRIPAEAYRPTFVKSLTMVPIRTKDPIGAIGTYWAKPYEATAEQRELMQALADSTSIAIENVQMYATLEKKVKERTAELEAFSYSVSHDLRAPLRSVAGYAQILKEDHIKELSPEAKRCLEKVEASAQRMSVLIEGLVTLSRLGRFEMDVKDVDLSKLAQQVFEDVRQEDQQRKVDFKVNVRESVQGDPAMLRSLMENLLRNAWKFTRQQSQAMVEFGSEVNADGERILYVKDNGAGFDMSHAQNLFKPFHRLHHENEFEGSGIGLATVQKIVARHGGRIWAEAKENQGAKIYFTLSRTP